jgi:hypothetical protein
VHGDIVGRDKIGLDEKKLVAALEARGYLQTAELAGLQRRTIISLAHRLQPDVLDFEQAIAELERAVEVALDVIARGERGANDDAFVNAVLARGSPRRSAAMTLTGVPAPSTRRSPNSKRSTSDRGSRCSKRG